MQVIWNVFGASAWLAVIVSGVLVTSRGRKARLAAQFSLYLLSGMACLDRGATLLGFGLWLLGTILSLSVMLHIPVFGDRDEHSDDESVQVGSLRSSRNFKRLSPLFITALVTIAVGLYAAGGGVNPSAFSTAALDAVEPRGILAFSRHFVANEWLKLEVVGILLLVGIVGAGVTARAEKIEQASREETDS